ncbi:hypothetical protein NDU88_002495 [Pleurodeles waltl]|uniref:Uncharacterized protein n=1 Tax=Pleurodeles waltl TaxID=8319 RepID=A0AAV7VDY7_PLEWA|nr:hypothetical protein NDU88_002495 [Pleurodeles waltl]
MNRRGYEHKIYIQLEDVTCYEKLTYNPMFDPTSGVNKCLKMWYDKCLLDEDEYMYLRINTIWGDDACQTLLCCGSSLAYVNACSKSEKDILNCTLFRNIFHLTKLRKL